MTAPQPTRLICTPWASIADLPESRPALDDATWEDLCWSASELLYQWSGKQYTGGCTSTVVLDTPPGAGSACWHRWEEPWVPRGRLEVRERVVALLPDSPVTAIESVTVGGVALTPEVDYVAKLPTGLVTRTGDRQWADGTRITYSHGIMPPIMGQRAAILLAVELGKSWTGSKCNLPKRVESITREGITISMVQALAGWRTGIWDIDAWLNSVNPGMLTRRAAAWSPDVVRTRRPATF